MAIKKEMLAAVVAGVVAMPALAGVQVTSSGGVASATGTAVLVGDSSSGQGVAVGQDAIAQYDSSQTVYTTGGNTVAVGRYARALYQGGTSLGGDTYTTALDATAVGVLSESRATSSIALGTYATVLENANASTALGTRSSVVASDLITGGTAAFTGTSVTDYGVISMGQSSAAQAALAALYTGSDTDTTTTLDTSHHDAATAFTRRIINVTDGVLDSDAVTVAQLKKVNTDLSSNITQAQNDISALQTVTTANTNSINTLAAAVASASSSGNVVLARVDALEQRVNKVERNANDGAALALATAGLVAPPEGKSGLVVGTGFYRDSSAIAVGYAYTGSAWGVKATASAAGRGNFGGSLSAGWFW